MLREVAGSTAAPALRRRRGSLRLRIEWRRCSRCLPAL